MFSAIQATFSRTWSANAFPVISMGEPRSFMRSALSLRVFRFVRACVLLSDPAVGTGRVAYLFELELSLGAKEIGLVRGLHVCTTDRW